MKRICCYQISETHEESLNSQVNEPIKSYKPINNKGRLCHVDQSSNLTNP
jgi:hypothetical protein